MTLRPPNLLKLLGFPVICVAMFIVLGGHWAVLQGVAWTTMVVEYSRSSDSLAAGVEKTFSGNFPCAMCKKIAVSKQQEEQKPATFKVDKKVEVFVALPRTSLQLPRPENFSYPVIADSRLTSRSDQPPVPVPIFA